MVGVVVEESCEFDTLLLGLLAIKALDFGEREGVLHWERLTPFSPTAAAPPRVPDAEAARGLGVAEPQEEGEAVFVVVEEVEGVEGLVSVGGEEGEKRGVGVCFTPSGVGVPTPALPVAAAGVKEEEGEGEAGREGIRGVGKEESEGEEESEGRVTEVVGGGEGRGVVEEVWEGGGRGKRQERRRGLQRERGGYRGKWIK